MKNSKKLKIEKELIDDINKIFHNSLNNGINGDITNNEQLKLSLGKVLELFSFKNPMDTDFIDDLKFIIDDYFESFGINQNI
ncbi:MAG: hypothetical protein V1779_05530 [bacterium]